MGRKVNPAAAAAAAAAVPASVTAAEAAAAAAAGAPMLATPQPLPTGEANKHNACCCVYTHEDKVAAPSCLPSAAP